MIEYSIEMLYHFNCSKCNKWWSIGDFKMKPGKILTCPNCGASSSEIVEKEV